MADHRAKGQQSALGAAGITPSPGETAIAEDTGQIQSQQEQHSTSQESEPTPININGKNFLNFSDSRSRPKANRKQFWVSLTWEQGSWDVAGKAISSRGGMGNHHPLSMRAFLTPSVSKLHPMCKSFHCSEPNDSSLMCIIPTGCSMQRAIGQIRALSLTTFCGKSVLVRDVHCSHRYCRPHCTLCPTTGPQPSISKVCLQRG